MTIIIAGGRDYNNYAELKERCDILLENCMVAEIITGGATGADALGKRYANEYGYLHREIKADWHKHGKAAGPIRNQAMAKIGNYLICYWDGESKGTASMIAEARKAGIPCNIQTYLKLK